MNNLSKYVKAKLYAEYIKGECSPTSIYTCSDEGVYIHLATETLLRWDEIDDSTVSVYWSCLIGAMNNGTAAFIHCSNFLVKLKEIEDVKIKRVYADEKAGMTIIEYSYKSHNSKIVVSVGDNNPDVFVDCCHNVIPMIANVLELLSISKAGIGIWKSSSYLFTKEFGTDDWAILDVIYYTGSVDTTLRWFKNDMINSVLISDKNGRKEYAMLDACIPGAAYENLRKLLKSSMSCDDKLQILISAADSINTDTADMLDALIGAQI